MVLSSPANKPMTQTAEHSEKVDAISWPKTVTEVHVHLGGSVPLYRLWEIAIERGIRGLGGGYEEFIELLCIQDNKVKDLDTYLAIYDTIELIQSGPQAVRESVIIATQRSYRTGGMVATGPGGEGGDPVPLFHIGRLELRMNPLKRTGAVFHKGAHAGLYDVDRVIKSACEAIEDVELGFRDKLQAGLIFCFGRDMTFEANKILAEKIVRWKERSNKIVGVDLAGPESVNSLADPKALAQMKELYELVGSDIGKTVHVGETPHVTLDTFVNTIEALNPDRVAHPIIALRDYWDKKDDRGLKLMQERGLVCELCARSNLLTRAVKSLDEYKRIINTLDDFEIKYTFSTDAPSLQLSTLAKELAMLIDNNAATSEQVLRALQVAEDYSFLPKTGNSL
jgi:adenosine deaminase